MKNLRAILVAFLTLCLIYETQAQDSTLVLYGSYKYDTGTRFFEVSGTVRNTKNRAMKFEIGKGEVIGRYDINDGIQSIVVCNVPEEQPGNSLEFKFYEEEQVWIAWLLPQPEPYDFFMIGYCAAYLEYDPKYKEGDQVEKAKGGGVRLYLKDGLCLGQKSTWAVIENNIAIRKDTIHVYGYGSCEKMYKKFFKAYLDKNINEIEQEEYSTKNLYIKLTTNEATSVIENAKAFAKVGGRGSATDYIFDEIVIKEATGEKYKAFNSYDYNLIVEFALRYPMEADETY